MIVDTIVIVFCFTYTVLTKVTIIVTASVFVMWAIHSFPPFLVRIRRVIYAVFIKFFNPLVKRFFK